MKMEKCIGGKMRKVVVSIGKKNINLIHGIIQYCDSNSIDELVILLFGEIYGKNSIVEKDGLIQFVNALPKESNLKIRLVREGLGYTLSSKDYHEIFDSTNYLIETTYSCKCGKYQLNFCSNNSEDSYWDDQYFSKLQNQASSPSEIKISAVYRPTKNDYLSEWGKSAWQLSEHMYSTLLYLDDGDVIEIVENGCIDIYQLDEQFNKKMIKKLK